MDKNPKDLINAFRKEKTTNIPFWFMRQAGRYLPEYREIRSQTKNFLDMCYTPEKAVEVTLQPIRRFGMSAAIIFSDILVIPDALGVDVRFEEKKGPLLVPVQTNDDLERLAFKIEKLEPVYEALRLTKKALPKETTLIGFAGSPWTLACYTVQGKADRDFQQVRSVALRQRDFFVKLIDLLTDSVIKHVLQQIKAGAEVIQLFDSWSGVLSEQEFSEWSIEPTKKIVSAIKAQHPEVPVIGFPRMSGSKAKTYARQTGIDAISVDASMSLEWIKNELQPVCMVQGNLDSLALAENKEVMLAQAKKIISTLGDKPFVFNLGHGILPHTPIEHVQALCDLLKNGTH